MNKQRCAWLESNGKVPDIYTQYHDEEWGVPVHDDNVLFEYLILEGAHAGLSWLTILKKREHYREAYDYFDPHKVARYDEAKQHALLQNPGIVRNRLKVASSVTNAQFFLDIQEQYGSFDAYIWRFVDGNTIYNHWQSMDELPSTTPISDAMSKDLKQRGFTFVGSTICYAFMQAVGLVNDHMVGCFKYKKP